jgi:uncharacterized delta-60 repeat protein
VIQQADGKLVVAGLSWNGSNSTDFSLVRLNANGTLDTNFGNGGKLLMPVGSSTDEGYSVIQQADGKLVVAGKSWNGGANDFSLVRLNADGTLDTSFSGTAANTLGGSASYTEGAAATVLDSSVALFDADLAALDNGAGNYAGASITMARTGGANAQDVFSATGALSFSGSDVLLSGVTVGTLTNAAGTLVITFNSNATQARVNQTLSAIGYSNSSDTPPASVQIDWTFSDGNAAAAQGTGGALTATGSTTVNITPTNDAPTLTAFTSPAASVNEDAEQTLSLADLLVAGNEADVDGTVTAMVVKAVSSGSLRIGADATSATAWDALTNSTVDATHLAFWTPGANANGSALNAFTVVAKDNAGLESATPVQLTLDVTAVNDAPTLSTLSTLTGASEDTGFTLTYAALAAAANEADVDLGDTLSFRVEALSTGTLTKGGLAVVPGTTLLASGESLVWTPAPNASGSALNAFTVVAWDGTAASATPVQLSVDVGSLNDAPTLTAFTSPAASVNEDAEQTLSLADLLVAGNEADVDGTVTAMVVKAVSSGSLRIGADATSATAWDALTNSTVDATHLAFWTPGANVFGSALNAFTVVAKDNAGLESATPVQLTLDVTAVNDAPTLSTLSTLTGASEDTGFTLTYAALAAAANEADVDLGDTLSFRVEALSTGTLTKGGLAVVPGTTLLASGESLVWTPAPNANGSALNAFTVVAWDGTAASATPVQLSVDVGSLNDAPTLTAFTSPAASVNEDAEQTLSLADLLVAGNEADVDGTVTAMVVKAVSSGSLRIGADATSATAWDALTNSTVDATHLAFWTPGANANGSALNAFTVVAKDNAGLESATPVQLTLDVTAVNDAPTLSTLSTLTGASEDTGFTLTYAALAAAANEADVDLGDTLSFRVEALSTGTLTKGGLAVVPGTTLLASGESLVWTPAPNASGSALNAFTVVAWDGTAASATPVQLSVDVGSLNDAPTLTAFTSPAASVNEDAEQTLSLADLLVAGNEADVDGTVTAMVVKAVSSGSLRIGADATSATAWDALTNSTVDATHLAFWTPGANVFGSALNAFTVVAKDNAGLESATPVQLTLDVTAVNDAPTLSTLSTLTGASEDTGFTLTYAALAAAANEADVDLGDTLSFRVEALSTGTLTKGGLAVVPGTTLLASGESLVWTPAPNANGSALNAFTVVAWDGTAASATPVQLSVDVGSLNDAPTLTAFTSPAASVNEDAEQTLSLADLLVAGNEADVDGTVTAMVVKAVSSGSLRIGADATSATAWDALTNSTVDATHLAFWTPGANANGSALNAFTVVAKDNAGLESATPVQLTLDVTAVNDAPTLSTLSTLTGASEDTGFTLTYAALAAAANEADVDLGDTLSFRVEALSTGTLTKGGLAVVPGTTLLASGESLVWTPAPNASGSALNAFTVVAWDGTAASATPVQLSVDVGSLNDAPTLTAFTSPAASVNEDAEQTLSLADLLVAGNEADVDGTVTAMVVKAVSSGSLRIGADATSATAWDALTNSTVDATHLAFWTPGANANRLGAQCLHGGRQRQRGPGVCHACAAHAGCDGCQ